MKIESVLIRRIATALWRRLVPEQDTLALARIIEALKHQSHASTI